MTIDRVLLESVAVPIAPVLTLCWAAFIARIAPSTGAGANVRLIPVLGYTALCGSISLIVVFAANQVLMYSAGDVDVIASDMAGAYAILVGGLGAPIWGITAALMSRQIRRVR